MRPIRSSPESRFSKSSRYLVYGLLLWTPVPLGSNRTIFWAINGLIASLALALFVLGEIRRGQSSFEWAKMLPIVAVQGVIIIWMLIQVWPGVPAPLAHPLWRDLLGASTARYATISISPAATWDAIAALVPILLLSVVAVRIGYDRQHGPFALRLVVLTCTCIAIYGIARQSMFASNGGSTQPFVVTGTFINRNTAATYFAIGLTTALALLSARMRNSGATGNPTGTISRGLAGLTQSWILVVAICILTVALLGTGSRAGTAATAVGAAVVLLLSTRPQSGTRSKVTMLLIVLVPLVVLFAGVSADLLLNRLQQEDMAADLRWAVYGDTLRLIFARPLIGHGAGTFADVYPLFHGPTVAPDFVWVRAHDTYLQIAAELGIPALLLIIGTGIRNAQLTWRAIGRRVDAASAAVAAIGVMTVVAVHSLFDFSIQIQSVLLATVLVVGVGRGNAMRLEKTAQRTRLDAEGDRNIGQQPGTELKTVYVEIPSQVAPKRLDGPTEAWPSRARP